MKVHKGDTVLVVSGKDKGAKGKVLQAYPTRNKVLVEGVNRIKKHTAISTNQRGAQSGGIVTQEAAIHVSNVMVVDSDGTPTRIGYRVDEETGKRVRISKRNGKDVTRSTRSSPTPTSCRSRAW
jgi:large subunit ribosomal protein L24